VLQRSSGLEACAGALFRGIRWHFRERVAEGRFPDVNGVPSLGRGLRRRDFDHALFELAAQTPNVTVHTRTPVEAPLMERGRLGIDRQWFTRVRKVGHRSGRSSIEAAPCFEARRARTAKARVRCDLLDADSDRWSCAIFGTAAHLYGEQPAELDFVKCRSKESTVAVDLTQYSK
jgi:2-polyprenyl-6-methoxyphenol hydroxylase-like FAD-dependent oxidoreductase